MNIQEKMQEEYREIKEAAEIKGTYIFPLAYTKLKEVKNAYSYSYWA